ncbi:MAG: hypothetical protein MUO26_15980 [Methanotrichaceae archaeon]|nr:hypothetical protein [Methanotrichaceae archaeon]
MMKLASYHRSRGDEVRLVRGLTNNENFNPDIIKITSLFTYAWKPVHMAIEYYHHHYSNSEITVGGIYASIMPGRIKTYYPFVDIHVGLFNPSERYLPDYDILKNVDKWSNWNKSIIFSSRGCVRNCKFCIVPKLEGRIKSITTSIQDFIHPDHNQIILWDNNFLASPRNEEILIELQDLGLRVDFNQGLDARLINEKNAEMLANLNVKTYRLAFDYLDERDAVIKAIDSLFNYGVRKRNILIYMLYNFYNNQTGEGDSPEDFLARINDILGVGCAVYPMRFEPLRSLKKGSYISPKWKANQLESIADARRVIGYGGAFPPYEGLIKKFIKAENFEEAFYLRSENRDKYKTKISKSRQKMLA